MSKITFYSIPKYNKHRDKEEPAKKYVRKSSIDIVVTWKPREAMFQKGGSDELCQVRSMGFSNVLSVTLTKPF